VARIYRTAWEAGCKGVTVYREGSRDGILLTKKEAGKRIHAVEAKLTTEINRLVEAKVLPAQAKLSAAPAEHELAQLTQAVDILLRNGPPQLTLTLTAEDRPLRPRPAILTGITLAQPAPEGNLQVTLNEVDDDPFEMLCHGGKAGSDIGAWAQALARLISIILRLQRLPGQFARLELIADQLEGIAGSRSIGFGPARVRSGPDAIAQAIRRYVNRENNPASSSRAAAQTSQVGGATGTATASAFESHPSNGTNGNACPRCGGFNLITDEGCAKCECGFREC
jgi:ribonucleoside-diphosphate reductase alpha chain